MSIAFPGSATRFVDKIQAGDFSGACEVVHRSSEKVKMTSLS
jgi:hypothetical protein